MKPSQILKIIIALLMFGALVATAIIGYRISYGLPII